MSKLLDRVRSLARMRHYSRHTEQALSAILFLYREILKIQLPSLSEFERAPRSRHVSVVLSSLEVRSVLAHLTVTHWLMASLLYGSGLRITGVLHAEGQGLGLR